MIIKSKPLEESQVIVIGGQTYIIPIWSEYVSRSGRKQNDIHANTQRCGSCNYRVSYLCSYILTTDVNWERNLPPKVGREVLAMSRKSIYFCSEDCMNEFIKKNKHLLIAEQI